MSVINVMVPVCSEIGIPRNRWADLFSGVKAGVSAGANPYLGVDAQAVLHCREVEGLFALFGWDIRLEAEGIAGIIPNGEYIEGTAQFFHRIAPFVDPDTLVAIADPNMEAIIAWFFDGQTVSRQMLSLRDLFGKRSAVFPAGHEM